MKPLLDENLSHKLVANLSDVFRSAAHVRDFGLRSAVDRDVWDYAKSHGFALVSKDGDFHQMSLLYGAPPKVVWRRVGNASTADIALLLRMRAADIAAFCSGEGSILVIDV